VLQSLGCRPIDSPAPLKFNGSRREAATLTARSASAWGYVLSTCAILPVLDLGIATLLGGP
jgi:hypothetical protein